MTNALPGVLLMLLCLLQSAYGLANLGPGVRDPANFLPRRILVRAETTTSIKPHRAQTLDRQAIASALPEWLSREPLGENESVNLYSFCHNDPINKVDVLGLAEVVTSTPGGNDVLVNDETSFWLIYNMMADAGLVGKLDPNGGKPTFSDAMVVAGKLGGKVKTYSKYFPGNASGKNSPNDLWIMPFTVPQLPGSPGGHLDSFLINSEATNLSQGNGFYLDAIDVRSIQAAGEATSAYPWGSLSKNEASVLSNRGATLTWLDTPLATLGDGSGEYWGPEWGKWQPIGGRQGGLYDYAMATTPWGTPRAVRNMLAVEIGTAGLAKGFEAFSMLGTGSRGMQLTKLKNWWNAGAEADPYWRSLSLKDKAFYEIGQKTLPGNMFEKYAHLEPVARGRALVNDMGLGRAIWPQGTGYRLGAGTTLHTGPTPLVRWFVPRAAGVGAAGGAAYYFYNSDD
jgi:hypothetical protein